MLRNILVGLILTLVFSGAGCDLNQSGPDFAPVVFNNNPDNTPNPNPGTPVTFCREVYTVSVDHFNGGGTSPQPLHATNWILRGQTGSDLLRVTPADAPNPCPAALRPETATGIPLVLGGRYSGMSSSTDGFHNYLNGVAVYGYLYLDHGHILIDDTIVLLPEWFFTDDFQQANLIPVTNDCARTMTLTDFATNPGATQWHTEGTLTLTMAHPEDVTHCGMITGIPYGQYANYSVDDSPASDAAFMVSLEQ